MRVNFPRESYFIHLPNWIFTRKTNGYMFRSIQLIISVFFASLSMVNCFAQGQDSFGSINLREFAVTANRDEKLLSELPKSVSVIESAEIEASACNSVAEILSTREGIFVVGTGQTPGSAQSIFTRGAGSNQTLIMIDGVRLTDPSGVSNAVDLSELSLANIERIEIVRGSHSTSYGSGAIGGVVNIITKKRGEKGLNVTNELRLGTFGPETNDLAENLHLNITGKDGLYANLSIYSRQVNGLDATTDTIKNPATFNEPDKDGFEYLDLQLKLGYSTKKFDASVGLKQSEQNADIDDGDYRDDDNYTLDYYRNLLSYAATYDFSDRVKLKFTGGISSMRREAIDDSSIINAAGKYDQSYLESSFKGLTSNNNLDLFIRSKKVDVLLGSAHYYESMNNYSYFYSGAFGPFSSTTNYDTLGLRASIASFYTTLTFKGSQMAKSLEKWGLETGINIHRHNLLGGIATFSMNPYRRWGQNGLVYGNLSSGFNAPSLYRLYEPTSYYTSGITRGNPNLVAETSLTAEIGAKKDLSKDLYLEVAVFNTSVNNAIEYVNLWDGGKAINQLGLTAADDYRGDTYLNLGKQQTTGIEMDIHYKLGTRIKILANGALMASNLTIDAAAVDAIQTQGNHVQLVESGAFLAMDYTASELTRRANAANISVEYSFSKNFALTLANRWVGKRTDLVYDPLVLPFGALNSHVVNSYFLTDLNVRYNLAENLVLHVKLENLMDVDYQEIFGYNTRGRGIFLKLFARI